MKFLKNENALVCQFASHLNTAVCNEIEPHILEEIGKGHEQVVFDLSEVEFVSSAFLRLCLKSYNKLGSDSFSIINTSPVVKKVFMVAGFDKNLNLE
jgi:anti-anti-sigma factor